MVSFWVEDMTYYLDIDYDEIFIEFLLEEV